MQEVTLNPLSEGNFFSPLMIPRRMDSLLLGEFSPIDGSILGNQLAIERAIASRSDRREDFDVNPRNKLTEELQGVYFNERAFPGRAIAGQKIEQQLQNSKDLKKKAALEGAKLAFGLPNEKQEYTNAIRIATERLQELLNGYKPENIFPNLQEYMKKALGIGVGKAELDQIQLRNLIESSKYIERELARRTQINHGESEYISTEEADRIREALLLAVDIQSRNVALKHNLYTTNPSGNLYFSSTGLIRARALTLISSDEFGGENFARALNKLRGIAIASQELRTAGTDLAQELIDAANSEAALNLMAADRSEQAPTE